MIGAFRRGEVGGFQIGETFRIRSIEEARHLAHLLYEELSKAHYAHLEPEPEFTAGVVAGIRSCQVLLTQKKEALPCDQYSGFS